MSNMGNVTQKSRAVKPAPPKLAEIASRIDAHLKRFERDPHINQKPEGHWFFARKPYFMPSVGAIRRLIAVVYNSQDLARLSKADALRYLAWLDAGNVGKHYEMPREPAR